MLPNRVVVVVADEEEATNDGGRSLAGIGG
jgi:hypothetical protein